MRPTDPIYLDAGAGTPLHPRARSALLQALEAFGDPAAPHAAGRAARAAVETARERTAAFLGVQPDEIEFTGGGAQANAVAVLGVAGAPPGGRIVTSGLEHPALLEAAASTGLQVIQIGCDGFGRVDVDRWAAEVARPGTVLACLQHADHHTGTLQPLAECATLARSHGVLVHTDASQTAAALPLDAPALGVDLLTLSAHTAYGPAGVGALFVRRGLAVDSRWHEAGRGSGGRETGNVPGIAAMGAALEALREETADLAGRLWGLSDRLRAELGGAGADIGLLGHPTQRVPQLLAWTAQNVDLGSLLMTLEDRGILAGTPPGGNAALVRAGLVEPDDAVVRFGLCRDTALEDVDRVGRVVPDAVRALRTVADRAGARGSRAAGAPAEDG